MTTGFGPVNRGSNPRPGARRQAVPVLLLRCGGDLRFACCPAGLMRRKVSWPGPGRPGGQPDHRGPAPIPRSCVSASVPAAVIVLAAGEGTRMKSSVPKVLNPVGGETMLGHVITAARELSPRQLIV